MEEKFFEEVINPSLLPVPWGQYVIIMMSYLFKQPALYKHMCDILKTELEKFDHKSDLGILKGNYKIKIYCLIRSQLCAN